MHSFLAPEQEREPEANEYDLNIIAAGSQWLIKLQQYTTQCPLFNRFLWILKNGRL